MAELTLAGGRQRRSSQATALSSGVAAPWQDLPPELLPRILARLPTNEVPCTARLVCKAAAAALSSPAHTTVRLSQPSPHGEFARRWGAPGAMRPLTLKRRHRLLCLTAASGCLHNLAWLVEHAGCFPDYRVLGAAAAAGRLEACGWLLQQGYNEKGYDELPSAILAAAGAGQRSTLEALLAHPGAQSLVCYRAGHHDFRTSLAIEAARGGHAGLMDWLLERSTPPSDAGWEYHLLSAAADGCDLPSLERLYLRRLQPRLTQWEQARLGSPGRRLRCAAASSRTPDWRAKVEWVEACVRAPLDDADACAGAAACPDALERLAWLRARGCPWDRQATTSAARAGNVEALSYLLAEGCMVDSDALSAAAEEGHLAALEVLHSHGRAATNPGVWAFAAAAAAREGQLPALRWMLERQLINLQQMDAGLEYGTMLSVAARSGSVELLALLHAGGCRWGEDDLSWLACAGSEEALEWAVAQGCPVQESKDADDDPYFLAAEHDDWGTLACLRRLAVPWRPLNRESGTFTDALRAGCTMPILRRLLELGCPVDWEYGSSPPGDADLRDWFTLERGEERRRSEGEGAPAVGA